MKYAWFLQQTIEDTTAFVQLTETSDGKVACRKLKDEAISNAADGDRIHMLRFEEAGTVRKVAELTMDSDDDKPQPTIVRSAVTEPDDDDEEGDDDRPDDGNADDDVPDDDEGTIEDLKREMAAQEPWEEDVTAQAPVFTNSAGSNDDKPWVKADGKVITLFDGKQHYERHFGSARGADGVSTRIQQIIDAGDDLSETLRKFAVVNR